MNPAELSHRRREMRTQTLAEAKSILTLAELPPSHAWELANNYWPDDPTYDDVRQPWWLFRTAVGLIEIGWRKRVLAIDWSTTAVRTIVTADDVTKSDTMVHAWTVDAAVRYVRALREAAGL